MLMVNSVPSVPYTRDPAVILKELVTVSEELKTKLWLMPSAGSSGQETFIGLQVVHVCAKTGLTRVKAPTRRSDESEDCILKGVLVEESK